MKNEETVKEAVKEAEEKKEAAQTINEVKYWQGFKAALEWVIEEEKPDEE